MKLWIGVGALVAAVAVVLPLLLLAVRPAPETATAVMLQPGQTYVFTMGDAVVIGEVTEKPRGQWVKVKLLGSKALIPAHATWVNLQLVKAVSVVDPNDVPQESPLR